MRRKFKKITLPIFMGAISLYISSAFLLGVLVGYIVMGFFSRKRWSIRFSLGNYKIHLHHWISAALGLTIVFITGVYQIFPPFVLGIGGGVVFQGIYSYNDWHKIIYREK